jgi:hypothetical protein
MPTTKKRGSKNTVDNTAVAPVSNNTSINNNTTTNSNVPASNNAPVNSKSLDNFFGVVIEKPPSPINLNNDIQPPTFLNLNSLNTLDNKANNKINNFVYSLTEIKQKIHKLTENELYEIFKIIKNNNEKYSTNKNWILVNLSILDSLTIKEISDFIVFCENNYKILNQEEHNRNLYRDLVN